LFNVQMYSLILSHLSTYTAMAINNRFNDFARCITDFATITATFHHFPINPFYD
jgi:Mg2+ and Co2+ transporter CorA